MSLDSLLSLFSPGIKAKRQARQERLAYQKWLSLQSEIYFRRIEKQFGLRFSSGKYGGKYGSFDYASSLLLVDMLSKFFPKAGITLPKELKALDICAGSWHYAAALQSFLKVYSGSSGITLEGIDFLGNFYKEEVGLQISGLDDVSYSRQDFFEMRLSPDYDVVFAMHPLATKGVHDEWKIPFHPLEQFWERALGMLKPGGVLVGCGYLWNGGASAFNSFPTEGRILHEHYYSPYPVIKSVDELSIKGFHENVVMMARKQEQQTI